MSDRWRLGAPPRSHGGPQGPWALGAPWGQIQWYAIQYDARPYPYCIGRFNTKSVSVAAVSVAACIYLPGLQGLER